MVKNNLLKQFEINLDVHRHGVLAVESGHQFYSKKSISEIFAISHHVNNVMDKCSLIGAKLASNFFAKSNPSIFTDLGNFRNFELETLVQIYKLNIAQAKRRLMSYFSANNFYVEYLSETNNSLANSVFCDIKSSILENSRNFSCIYFWLHLSYSVKLVAHSNWRLKWQTFG